MKGEVVYTVWYILAGLAAVGTLLYFISKIAKDFRLYPSSKKKYSLNIWLLRFIRAFLLIFETAGGVVLVYFTYWLVKSVGKMVV